MLAAPAAVHAQEAVPLTLEYHRGLEKEGALPEGTEVLVYDEAGGSSVMLSGWGSPQEMRDVLVERADASFSETYDRLNASGATRSIRVPIASRHRAYVLARVPAGASGPRFYETQIGRNDVTSPPDLEIIVSGNMKMSPISEQDTAWAAETFERVLDNQSIPLTLQSSEASFNEDALVRVWPRPADEGTALSRDELSRDDATASALTADETIEDRFDRTAYSGNAVYVLVRTTSAEGEPVLYESVGDDGAAGFGAVTDGTISMQPVPEEHRATMAAFFPEQESGGSGISWMFYGLVGGLLLVVVFIVGRGLAKKKQKKNRRRQKSMRERFWVAAASSAASGSNPAEETSGQELVEAGTGEREKGAAVSSRTSEPGGRPKRLSRQMTACWAPKSLRQRSTLSRKKLMCCVQRSIPKTKRSHRSKRSYNAKTRSWSASPRSCMTKSKPFRT
ncbi:hypothetical protein CRI93_05695 [Longimonas halophila]|uniref:Uncharacterized protein n=1 Tax=Longimonas halophila TaxID=1469170 RepID=A0A2H3NMK9_9BACT|nr:hypothetical protein CRI93_05695 [Longimonas halophila]